MAVRSSINLLTQELRVPKKTQELRPKLIKTGGLLLILYTVAMLLIGALLFVLSSRLGSINANNQSLRSQIGDLKDVEGLLLSVKNRAALANSVLSKTSASDKLLDEIAQIIPPNLDVVEVGSDIEAVSLTLNARSSLEFSRFLDVLKTAGFEVIVLKNLSLTPGGYTFSLKID